MIAFPSPLQNSSKYCVSKFLFCCKTLNFYVACYVHNTFILKQDKQCKRNVKLRRVRAKPLFSWKSNKFYILRVCVLALGIGHAMRMRHVICGLPVLQYLTTLSHKRHDFRKMLLNIKSFKFSLQMLFWKISHSKKNWLKIYNGLQVPVILVGF